MAIKVPDNFRPSDYGIRLSIPKPDMECRKNEDGSFSLYARYSSDISDFAREAAREMNDKMEAELIDELLRMNGYVPERTCHVKQAYFHNCSELDNLMEGIAFSPEDTVACICDSCGMDWRFDRGIRPNYCPNCGAKVEK